MDAPQQASKKTIRLNRKMIAQAALKFVEAHGIEGLTMRALATEIGCGTMSLYSYITSREDLLVAIGEELAVPLQQRASQIDQGEGWLESARAAIGSYRELAEEYPRSFELIALMPYNDDSMVEYLDGFVGLLIERGLPEDLARDLFGMLDAYMSGFLVVWARGQQLPESNGGDEDFARKRARVAAMRDLDAFERGLDVIFWGFEQRIRNEGITV